MKRDQRKGSRGKYRMAAVLAAFCVIGNGIVALGAPVSDEEQLTAGVGQILDSLPETTKRKPKRQEIPFRISL